MERGARRRRSVDALRHREIAQYAARLGRLERVGHVAGMPTIVPGLAWTGEPPIVTVSDPSSTSTTASNGDVCSVSPCQVESSES